MKPPQRQTGQSIWFIDLLLFCKIQAGLVSDPVNILYWEYPKVCVNLQTDVR